MSFKTLPPGLPSYLSLTLLRFCLKLTYSFLPAHPYHDSITLNTLAGLLALLIAQPASNKSSSSSSSSSDDSDSDFSTKPTARKRKAVDPPSAELQAKDEPNRGMFYSEAFLLDNLADLLASTDFTFWLRDLSTYSSAQLDKAREHFRRGARLERKNDPSFGEASRWLAIVSWLGTV